MIYLLVVTLVLGLVMFFLTRRSKPVEVPVVEPRIVSAVATMAATKPNRGDLAKQIEDAMSQAVQDCLDKGISINEVEEIRAAMLEARLKVLDENR
jgi:hypothetical protein